MSDLEAYLLSDHLAEALACLSRARDALRSETVNHREAAVHELTRAELSIARVIGLVAGSPQ